MPAGCAPLLRRLQFEMPSERVKRQQQKKRQRVQRMPRALQRARWATLAAPLQVAPPATEAAVRAALQALQAQLLGSAAGSSAEQAGGRAGLPPAAATRSWPLGGPQQAPAAAGAGPTGGSAGRGRPQRASSKRVAEVVAQERQAEVLDLTGWDSEEEEEAEGGSTEDEEQQATQSSGGTGWQFHEWPDAAGKARAAEAGTAADAAAAAAAAEAAADLRLPPQEVYMVDLTAEEEEEEQPQQQANAGGLPLAAQAHLVSVKRSHGLAFGASEAAAGQDLEQRQQGAAAEGVEGEAGAAKEPRLSCRNCGLSGVRLQRCSACKSVYYCSAACQRADWPRHTPECGSLASAAAGQAAPQAIQEPDGMEQQPQQHRDSPGQAAEAAPSSRAQDAAAAPGGGPARSTEAGGSDVATPLTEWDAAAASGASPGGGSSHGGSRAYSKWEPNGRGGYTKALSSSDLLKLRLKGEVARLCQQLWAACSCVCHAPQLWCAAPAASRSPPGRWRRVQVAHWGRTSPTATTKCRWCWWRMPATAPRPALAPCHSTYA